MSLTYIDLFCGAGGSSIGLTAAGMTLTLAANHWPRAIETHSANFPDAEHLCADINVLDKRRLPKANILWGSPICTELSPAGGTRRGGAQIELFGHVAAAGLERTRATFYDVLAAAEVWRYDAVLVENVVEVARVWELFDHWTAGMCLLGYNVQFVSVSSAHVGSTRNRRAPQWRDRLYLVFTRKGIPLPNVEPRPLARCEPCGKDVRARQAWKNPANRKIGKYRQQYVYVCPNTSCRHAQVEPYVLPAAAAIDWADLGERIGDRATPLATATMRRIQLGLELFAHDPFIVDRRDYDGADGSRVRSAADPMGTVTAAGRTIRTLVTPRPFVLAVNHDGHRAFDPATRPLPARTAKLGEGIVVPLRRNGKAHKAGEQPLVTVTGGGNHHALVVPYYRTGRAKTTATPLDTLTSRERFALVDPAAAIEDCSFRMLTPREQLRAQRFPDSYVVHGNKSEQTMQAGNAVSSNVAQWLGQQIAAVLA